MNFSEYINFLRGYKDETSYIDLDKDKEIRYLEAHKYRFIEIINSICYTSHSMKILDIGTTPFTLFLKMYSREDLRVYFFCLF